MAYYNPKIETKQIARELLDELLPAWEASYEPGNVSDYLIGYANDEAAAKGAAIAWVTSQTDKDPATLEWVEMPVGDQHDHWYDLIQNHDDGIPTDTGVNVRRRLPATVRDAARQAAGQPAADETVRVGRCPVMLQGGGRCEKNADHRPPGSDDPHTPEPPAAGLAAPTNHNTETETTTRWVIEAQAPNSERWFELSHGFANAEQAHAWKTNELRGFAMPLRVAQIDTVTTTTILDDTAAGAES